MRGGRPVLSHAVAAAAVALGRRGALRRLLRQGPVTDGGGDGGGGEGPQVEPVRLRVA